MRKITAEPHPDNADICVVRIEMGRQKPKEFWLNDDEAIELHRVLGVAIYGPNNEAVLRNE